MCSSDIGNLSGAAIKSIVAAFEDIVPFSDQPNKEYEISCALNSTRSPESVTITSSLFKYIGLNTCVAGNTDTRMFDLHSSLYSSKSENEILVSTGNWYTRTGLHLHGYIFPNALLGLHGRRLRVATVSSVSGNCYRVKSNISITSGFFSAETHQSHVMMPFDNLNFGLKHGGGKKHPVRNCFFQL